MALFTIPGQNLTMEIPDEGAVFRGSGTGEVYRRTGNAFEGISEDILSNYRNIRELPTYDMSGVLSLARQGIFRVASGFGENSVRMFLGAVQPKSTREIISLTPDPQNPNAALITSSERGVLTPSTRERQLETTRTGLGRAEELLGLAQRQAGADAAAGRVQTYDPNTINAVQQYLEKKKEEGYVLNPNIQIDEKVLADFVAQASREIDPYYVGQLKLAVEGFQRKLGYSTDELLRQEKQLEQKYGQKLRSIGEVAAEQGFALSGAREREERELAQETQEAVNKQRRELGFEAGGLAREFAQRYGVKQTTIPTIAEAPRVAEGFARSGRQLPFYELSPSVYEGLIGSQQFEQEAAKRKRTAELKQAFNLERSLGQQRQLEF